MVVGACGHAGGTARRRVLESGGPAYQSAAGRRRVRCSAAARLPPSATSTIHSRVGGAAAAGAQTPAPRRRRLHRPDPDGRRQAGHQRRHRLDEVHLERRDGLVERAAVGSIGRRAGGDACAALPGGGGAALVEGAGDARGRRQHEQHAEDGHLDGQTLESLDAAAIPPQCPPDAMCLSTRERKEVIYSMLEAV